MKLLRALSRFLFGILFVFSGFLKAVDPIGTALKIKEYMGVMGLDSLDFLSIPIAVLLAASEFLVGVAILKGLRIETFSKIALAFISFFTLLTLWIAIANPINDCGCFGEALHLSNKETFIKNVVLFFAALLVFLQRKKFHPIATPRVERGYLAIYVLLILFLQWYSLRNLPQIDFGIYKPGTDLVTTQQALQEKEYETTFIYSKDGIQKEFTLDSLPDSSWEFVDAKSVLVNGTTEDTSVDFSFMDASGTPVGSEILMQQGSLFFLSVYNIGSIEPKYLEKIQTLADTLQAHNLKLYIVSANPVEQTEALFDGGNNYEILYSDYKAVISFNRSSGGLTYINGGIIVKKWAKGNYPTAHIEEILSQDPEIITAKVQIKEHLFAEISLFVILFLIVMIRFFSKIIYNKHFAQITHIHLERPHKKNSNPHPEEKDEVVPTSSDPQ